MTTSTAPQTNPGTDTPSASYVLRRRYGRARHVILTATWITVINMFVGPIAASAATYTWDHDGATTGSKNWSSANSWNPNGVPTFVAGDTLDLSTVNITGGATCNLDAAGSITLGTITIGDATTSSSAWVLSRSGSQVLILDNGVSAAAINQTVTSFGDSIGVPLSLLSNLAIDNLSANSLQFVNISAGSAGLKTVTVNNTGTGPVTINSPVIDGSGQVALEHKAGTLTLSLASTFTGGFTLTAGTVAIGNNTALGGAAGAVNLNGGTLRSSSTTGYTIANTPLAISGTVTLGDRVNTGTLTFTGANQTISDGATVTMLSAVTFGSGLVVGNNVTFAGPAAFTLPGTGNGNPAIKIGDGTTFSGNSVGGNVSATTQTILGTGAITINYGGKLTASFINPSNAITVNAGGVAGLRGTPSAAIIVNSGGAIGGVDATLALTTGANLTLPGAGYLLNVSTAASTISGAYPSFTGTMAFGGSTALNLTTGGATSFSGDKTLAFNQTAMIQPVGSGGMALNGLNFGGTLTVAGSGQVNVFGALPMNDTGSTLGAITGGGNIVVAMSPLGIVLVTGSTGWVNTTINSGTLIVTTSGANIGSGTLTLNGGALRLANNSSSSKYITVGPNGGAIEGLNNANNSNGGGTYSGKVTGTSAVGLVLRAGTDRAGYASDKSFSVSGDFTEFNGNITLAVGNTPQPIDLGANALPNTGYNVIVPGGIAFKGAAFNNGTSSRFTTTQDSIFIPGATIDLSTGGLNKDISVGLNGTSLTSYTLPNGVTTYRLVPVNQATTLSSLVFIDGNSLTFSGSATLTDSNSGIFQSYGRGTGIENTVTITAAQTYTGATTITGTIPLAGQGKVSQMTLQGSPVVVVVRNSLDTTSINVLRGTWNGLRTSLTVSGAHGAVGSATAINVSGGGIFTSGDGVAPSATDHAAADTVTIVKHGATTGAPYAVYTTGGGLMAGTTYYVRAVTVDSLSFHPTALDAANNTSKINLTANIQPNLVGGINTSRLSDSAVLTLGGTEGGGTFNLFNPVTGTEAVGSLVVAAGSSSMTATTGTLSFGGAAGTAYTRSVGGVLTFSAASPNVQFANAQTGTSTAYSGAGNRILVGSLVNVTYGAAGTADFAVAGAGANLVAPTYVTENALNLWTGENIYTTANTTGTLPGGVLTINSLKIGPTFSTITLGASDALTIRSGMIVYTGAASNRPFTFSGGTLTSGNGQDLILHSTGAYNDGRTKISSQIVGNLALTRSGDGVFALDNANNEIGHIYLLGGLLDSLQAGSLGAVGATRTIYFQGGYLQFSLNQTPDFTNTSLVVGAGGCWTDDGVGNNVTFRGSVTLNGHLVLGIRPGVSPGPGLGVKTLTGAISGPGSLIINTPSRVTLSGDNGAWSGGLTLASGALVRLNHANAAGSGPIYNTLVTGAGNLNSVGIVEFMNGFGNSLNNDLLVYSGGGNGFIISNAKTTGGAVTLSGKICSFGLTFQGVDDGAGNVSETVLANSVAVSGSQANNYNYAGPASGNATSSQLFVNGQGGINLGVTAYAGATATRLAYGTAGFLAYNAGTTTPVENGAEGYVRFAPDANGYLKSFIPGAVGPGYVAALRKGGAPARNFGYFLTGSSAGTAYQLPEGKSFLIGTLGSGTGQTGTLGTTGTGSNTAILLGNPKAAAGQLLAGIGGGDINIHANAAADTAALNLSARNASDTLVLGDGVTAANNVVITPTWGDSGATTTYTLLRKRTGATTLNKIGAGTVEIKGANFTHTDGTDARGTTTLKLDAGTLYYNQNDASAADFAGVTLTGGTLKFKLDGASCTKINSAAAVALGSSVATLALEAGATPSQSQYVLIQVAGTSGGVTGAFANSKVTVGSKNYQVVTNGGDGNDVALNQIVSGTLILLR
jgi:hypothetical protein